MKLFKGLYWISNFSLNIIQINELYIFVGLFIGIILKRIKIVVCSTAISSRCAYIRVHDYYKPYGKCLYSFYFSGYLADINKAKLKHTQSDRVDMREVTTFKFFCSVI